MSSFQIVDKFNLFKVKLIILNTYSILSFCGCYLKRNVIMFFYFVHYKILFTNCKGLKMNTKQVRSYYEKKKDFPCPLTEKLIKAGYQQTDKGYIKRAKKNKEYALKIDYREAEPNQWWHLIESYCDNTEPDVKFTRNIQCGELIFWMAEVANCVEQSKMEKLVNDIIASGKPINVRSETKPNVIYDRGKWNREIQNLCFENITKIVEEVHLYV
jgi:hypothetical protein